MRSPSRIAENPTIYRLQHFSTSEIDMSDAESRSIGDADTFSVLVQALLTSTFRTTLIYQGGDRQIIEDSDDPALARGGVDVGAYLAQQERDPEMAAAMAAMRRRVAPTRHQPTLATLRQHAGLSQSQLAATMGTQQPNIARWERDPAQMTARTIQRLAAVLRVTEQEIHDVMPRATTLGESTHG